MAIAKQINERNLIDAWNSNSPILFACLLFNYRVFAGGLMSVVVLACGNTQCKMTTVSMFCNNTRRSTFSFGGESQLFVWVFVVVAPASFQFWWLDHCRAIEYALSVSPMKYLWDREWGDEIYDSDVLFDAILVFCYFVWPVHQFSYSLSGYERGGDVHMCTSSDIWWWLIKVDGHLFRWFVESELWMWTTNSDGKMCCTFWYEWFMHFWGIREAFEKWGISPHIHINKIWVEKRKADIEMCTFYSMFANFVWKPCRAIAIRNAEMNVLISFSFLIVHFYQFGLVELIIRNIRRSRK